MSSDYCLPERLNGKVGAASLMPPRTTITRLLYKTQSIVTIRTLLFRTLYSLTATTMRRLLLYRAISLSLRISILLLAVFPVTSMLSGKVGATCLMPPCTTITGLQYNTQSIVTLETPLFHTLYNSTTPTIRQLLLCRGIPLSPRISRLLLDVFLLTTHNTLSDKMGAACLMPLRTTITGLLYAQSTVTIRTLTFHTVTRYRFTTT